jgi:hypothetical protein
MGVIFGALPAWTRAGSGYGDGYGYGDGSGDGSGYGDGSGDGDGYGYGDGSGWMLKAKASSAKWTKEQQERLAELESAPVVLALWRSDARGCPANGGSGKPVHPGLVQEIPGPLALCTKQALHATVNPEHWEGPRIWLVALHGEVAWQDDKCGALKREIVGEITA